MPMGNMTKYLQKLGMGVYNNEKQPGVSKKITQIWGNRVLAHRLEVNYVVGKQILLQ